MGYGFELGATAQSGCLTLAALKLTVGRRGAHAPVAH